MLSRAALRSVSGCPVTGSRVLRGSIGPAVTLRLPLPLVGMFVCGGTASMSVVRSVCPAADCGAGGVGVILLWIGRLCGLNLPPWTNALDALHW